MQASRHVKLTSIVIQLLHDLSDNLADRLYSFNIVFGLLKVLLEVLQGESHYMDIQ